MLGIVCGMDANSRRSIIGIAVAVVLGLLVALAGSDGSVTVGTIAVFGIGAAIAYALNWIAYIPSNRAKTEQYYDLTGSITYLTVMVAALALSSDLDLRAGIAAAMVGVWALRLGTFLFRRVRRDGKDGRFDEIKLDPLRFLMAWTLQGLWVLLTVACALAIVTSAERKDLEWLGFIGIAVWIAGFAIEVIADRQKSAFRADPANEGRFITTGLWAWSRHPNYFGEIMLWTGMAIMAIPILSGWRWVLLISPIFVTVLLTRISGVPMLERRAEQRWGDDPEFRAYTDSTPSLVLRPPKS